MSENSELRPVVVTTAHRGVFVGYTTDPSDAEIVRLERGRMIVYWPESTRSVVGLAVRGPGAGSRVSPPATITLRNVTSVIEATVAASEAWEEEPWE
jgi:hypothetical protein